MPTGLAEVEVAQIVDRSACVCYSQKNGEEDMRTVKKEIISEKGLML